VHRFDVGDSNFNNAGGWRSQAVSIISHGIFNYAMICTVLLNCILMTSNPLKIETKLNNEELLVQLAEYGFELLYT